jgi:hypothetical protein
MKGKEFRITHWWRGYLGAVQNEAIAVAFDILEK